MGLSFRLRLIHLKHDDYMVSKRKIINAYEKEILKFLRKIQEEPLKKNGCLVVYNKDIK